MTFCGALMTFDPTPTSRADWKYEQTTTRATVDITFRAGVAPGAQVWFSARWINPRDQPGPGSQANGTNVQEGMFRVA